MEPPEFWRDLQAQFRALPDPRGDLHALDLPDNIWCVGGGPDERETRERLQQLFRALAERAAIAAELPGRSPLDAWLDHLKQGPFFNPTETGTETQDGKHSWVVDGGWINHLCIASAESCIPFETIAYADLARERKRHATSPSRSRRQWKTALARNVDRLRKECGWSYDELAAASDLDRKTVLRHVNGGAGAFPRTLKAYADAFSKRLGRTIAVEDLQK